jgi:hypothetical protein
MRMPDATFELLKTFARRNPVPQGPPGAAHEENCRQWTHRLAEQCAFSFPDQGYGCKRAGQGRPLSKDCLAQRSGDQLRGYDIMTGAGTGRPVLPNSPPEAQDLRQQIFEPVVPTDHLNLGRPTQPVPSPPGPESGQEPSPATPQAPVDLSLVLTQLGALQREIATVRTEVAGLRAVMEGLQVGQPAPAEAAPDAALRTVLEQAGWPVEINAGVMGTLKGWIGRKP